MDFFRDVYEHNLNRHGFAQVRQREREGHLFALSSQAARGRYWVYALSDLFAVSQIELTLHRDFSMAFEQTFDIQIVAQYESACGVALCGNRGIHPSGIREYLPRGSGYEVLYDGGRQIRGVSITFHPGLCGEYLKRRYPGDVPPLQTLFESAALRPQFSRIMGEIKSFRGAGISAKLYYESKALETLSLLLRQGKEEVPSLSGPDLARIEEAKAFIHLYYPNKLCIDQLARLACMCPTKFKTAFKAAAGLPAAQYVAQIRMERAAALLKETDLPVAEVARQVGYKKPGAFAHAYRAFAGELPGETRRGRAWNQGQTGEGL